MKSVSAGEFFSNFYGGVIVGATQYEPVTRRLEAVKSSQNLLREAKWSKVTDQYLGKYKALVNAFFDEVDERRVRVRIMFSQTSRIPVGLTEEDIEHGYFKLCYQFIKHAFGLGHMPRSDAGVSLRLYFDEFPETAEKIAKFKGYLLALAKSRDFRSRGLRIHPEDIAEVRSHDHVILQCLDIVLGAMAFRLNERQRVKPDGSHVRGKRTRAKEALYREIVKRVQCRRPHFNFGESTGTDGDPVNVWEQPYRHWKFVPSQWQMDHSKTKSTSLGKRNRPSEPT